MSFGGGLVGRVVRLAGPIALALLLARVTLEACRPLRDPDFWWHIRLGQRILDEGVHGPVADWAPLAQGEWVPTQVLPDLLSARVYEHWGLPGIAWLFGAALVAFVVSTYLLCRSRSGVLVAVLVTVLVVVGAGGSLSPRPQILSFVLLAITLAAWLLTERDHRARWWVVPLTWLWALSHGMWVLSPLIGACVVVGLALGRDVAWRRLARLAGVVAASAVAPALTPLGPSLPTAPLTVNERTQYIAEWQPTSVTDPLAWCVAAMLVAVALLWLGSARHELSWGRALLFVQAVGWLFLAGRTVALAAVIVAPLLAAALQASLPSESRVPAWERVSWRELWRLGGAVALCLAVLTLAAPATADRPGAVPDALNTRLERIPPGSVVFNDDRLGGWLLLDHPNVTPVLGGLSDAYPVTAFERYREVVGLGPAWRAALDELGARRALIPQESGLAIALRAEGWRAWGDDRGYQLLVAPGQEG